MIATAPVCLLRWSIQESTKPRNHLVLIIPQAHNCKDLATSESFCPFPRMNLNDDFFPLKSDFPPDSVSPIPRKRGTAKIPGCPSTHQLRWRTSAEAINEMVAQPGHVCKMMHCNKAIGNEQ